jgi:hypothetical protein
VNAAFLKCPHANVVLRIFNPSVILELENNKSYVRVGNSWKAFTKPYNRKT